MRNVLKYTYGYYKDGNIFVIECLNNFELFGQSETKKDIVKNTIDFTTGILELCLFDQTDFPEFPELVRNEEKYEDVFELHFDSEKGIFLPKKQPEKV